MLNSIQFNGRAGGGGWGNKLKIFGSCGVCICVCVCVVCVFVCVCYCIQFEILGHSNTEPQEIMPDQACV